MGQLFTIQVPMKRGERGSTLELYGNITYFISNQYSTVATRLAPEVMYAIFPYNANSPLEPPQKYQKNKKKV